jgi:ADP-heptose:LPS heptosyltransferase
MAVHPQVRFQLFGTANDRAVTDAVALDLGASIENLAGRTDLTAFAARLAECRLLISNDTGGLHLANALGVPVLALFGPTNPLRTAPVFQAPVRVLQPAGCPPAGGGKLADLSPDAVLVTATEMLA